MSGIFGVVSREDCAESLFYGTDYHSHLGTEYGGLAVLGTDFERHIRDVSQSQFKSKFYDDYKGMKGNKGIGVISASEEQPIYLRSKFVPFCIATNGRIENAEELTEKMLEKGISFSEMSKKTVNVTELIAKIISQGSSLINGIENLFDLIDEEGMVQKKKPTEDNISQICAFLWIYTGFPASSYDGINVEIVRERCGRYLAKHDKDIDVDLVTGVPDSGIAHGLGYSMESGKPFRRPLVNYTPGYGSSYTPPSQAIRDH